MNSEYSDFNEYLVLFQWIAKNFNETNNGLIF